VTIAALVAAACASGSRATPDAIAGGRSSGTTLTTGDVDVLASLLEAADTRRADTTLIDRALASPNPFVRAFAARTAGQIGVTARTAVLRSLTADPDTAVAADAAFSLGLLTDAAAASSLASALRGGPTVADAAAWSLGELGDAGRPIIEAALRSGEPRRALPEVLQASAKLKPVPATLIAPYSTDTSLVVRRAAVYALTRTRVPAGARAVIAIGARLTSASNTVDHALPDADSDLRSYVARGLGQPVVGDSLGAPALVILRRFVEDADPHVRINAIRSLATYGPIARPELVRHLRDADANARITVAQSLGGILGTSRLDWTDAWAADTAFTFRRMLLASAIRSGVRPAALDPATPPTWQQSADWRYRAAAAEAAGTGSAGAVDSIASPLFRDADPRVRAAAYGAAVALADSASAASKPYGRAALRAALADSDLFVRATILGGLRSSARAADAWAALGAWRRAARDAENDARVAALRVIATAWRDDSASFGALVDSLAALPPPADPLERAAASGAGPLRDWPRTGVAPRPRAWYVDQARTLVGYGRSGHPPQATITTARGPVRIVLFGTDAPLTVANFVALARRGYYNGLAFHRVVPNFVAQDGAPRGDGSGGPGYAIRDELNRHWYDRGAVGMALSGPDTGGSQYFLTHSPQPHLDGHYTVFAHVVAGLDVLDAIVQGDRIVSITIQ